MSSARFRRLAAKVQARRQAVEATIQTIRQAVPALDMAWEGVHRFHRNNGSVLIGFLTYRLFLWMVPLTFVLIGLLGYSSAVETFSVLSYASEYGIDEQTSQELVTQAESGRHFVLTASMFALVWATRGLIYGLHYAFAQASGLEIRSRPGVVREALLAVPAAVVMSILILAVGVVQSRGPVLTLTAFAGFSVGVCALFWFICRTMPHRPQHWYQLLPGPVVAVIGLTLLQMFLALYLPRRIASASELYGSVGVALAILFTVFLWSSLLIAMPFVNDLWFDRRTILDGRPWVLDPGALPKWVQRPAHWVVRRDGDSDRVESDGE